MGSILVDGLLLVIAIRQPRANERNRHRNQDTDRQPNHIGNTLDTREGSTKMGRPRMPEKPEVNFLTPIRPTKPPPIAEAMQLMINGFFLGRVTP